MAAVPITNTVAQDLKEREVNKVPTPELDKAQEEEKQQKYTSSHPYAEHQQWRRTPTDPMEALQQQYYSLHQRLQRIEDMHVGLESTEHMPPEQEEEEIPHTPPTADQSTSPRQGIPTLQQEEPQPQHSEKAHMSTPTRPRIRASSLDAGNVNTGGRVVGVWTVVCTNNLFWSYFQFSVVFSFIFPSLPSSTFFLRYRVYSFSPSSTFFLRYRVYFLDTEFVLFFICSDLIDFIFIFITFHLSCTAVSGSWIKDLFIYLFI